VNAETGRYHKEVTIVQAAQPPACGCAHIGPFDRPEWFALLADSRPGAFVAETEADDSHASLALNRVDGRIESLRNWYAFTW